MVKNQDFIVEEDLAIFRVKSQRDPEFYLLAHTFYS